MLQYYGFFLRTKSQFRFKGNIKELKENPSIGIHYQRARN